MYFLNITLFSDRVMVPVKDLHFAIKQCSYCSQHRPHVPAPYVVLDGGHFGKLVVRMATYRGI